MNIYVGNLDFKVNENDLEGIFDEYGTISSAKIIIVGATTENHLLYISHIYRQIIENVSSVFKNTDGSGLGLYNLIGRTTFKRWEICNIAALYHLKFRHRHRANCLNLH